MHRYLDFDGWKYWTMGYVTEATVLINRAKLGAGECGREKAPNAQVFMAKARPVRWDEQ